MSFWALENNIDQEPMKNFTLYRNYYEWRYANNNIKNDGPNILYFMMEKINPGTKVGAQTYKSRVNNTKPSKYEHAFNYIILPALWLSHFILEWDPY